MNKTTSRIGQKSAGTAGGTAGASGAAGGNGAAGNGSPAAGNGAAGTPGAAAGKGTETPNVIELAELTTALKTAVAEGLAGFPSITEEKIAAAVKAAIEAHEAKGAKMTPEALAGLAKSAVTTALEGIRKPSAAGKVAGAAAGDAGEGPGAGDAGEGRVELGGPSWTKGNLPLHGKQLANVLLGKPVNEGIDASLLRKGVVLGDRIYDRMRAGRKALTSTGSGTGDELVDSDLSSELQRRLYLESILYAALAANEIDMPTQPYTFPLSTTRPTFKFESVENTDATGSTPGTGNVTLDAKKFMALVEYSYESDEDSVIAILPFLQRLLGEAAAADFESVILNGDTTATHMDSDTHAISKAAEKSMKGFRKLALANSGTKLDISTGGISAANWRAMKKKMGKYGKATSDLLTIVGVLGENDILGLSEVATVDKVGPRAAIITGTVASIYNSPIITSEKNREDLNASGVYDGTTTTKGSVLLVNRSRFLMGRRREFTIEVDRSIKSQTHQIVASFRRAMTPIETPSDSVPSLCIGYNYTA